MYNTVDNPIFPTTGKKLTPGRIWRASAATPSSTRPRPKASGTSTRAGRRSACARANVEFTITTRTGPTRSTLPIFEKLFLGGEYSIRGFDIRSVGPRDLTTGIVIGGNKSLLFNAEYLITIAGPVRLVLFCDAGQVRDGGESFAWRENIVADDRQPADADRRGDLALRGRRVRRPPEVR